MGKPVTQAEAEIQKCAWACDYYAENGEKFLPPGQRATSASESYIAFGQV